MKPMDFIRRADQLQHTRGFKITASVLLLLLICGGLGAYAIALSTGRISDPTDAIISRLSGEMAQAERVELLRNALTGSSPIITAAVGASVGLLVGLVVVWLGLGLTYLLLIAIAGAAAGLAYMFDPSSNLARLIIGLVALSASFTALMQGLRVLFSAPTPVFSIAKNVLAEAVRLKVSLVFIVLLLIGLASLPMMLDPEQPLRYRVQSFLQWGTGGSFWILAILTLFFGVATVTFEQRDKVIWQTITKPVSATQYLLGKWLGVVGLNAVLLIVCASGIFLFTDYLRRQPAQGESAAFQAVDGGISEDRLKLQTEVLQARNKVYIEYPVEMNLDSDVFMQRVDETIENEQLNDPNFASTPATRLKLAKDMLTQEQENYRALGTEGADIAKVYVFSGLQEAREKASPIILRYKIDAKGNRPDVFFKLTFEFPDGSSFIRESGLGFFHNVSLSPEYITPNGRLVVRIYNGAVIGTPRGPVIEPNDATARFPSDGLQVTYVEGSYQANYLRVVFILWVKLAFLAMVAVVAGTFLSFPVASLVAFGTFLLAEMSKFIGNAVDYYGYKDIEGNVRLYRIIGTHTAQAVGWMFDTYAQLKPTNNIVEGIFLPWGAAVKGVTILMGFTVIFFFIGVVALRRRELAIYSGQ